MSTRRALVLLAALALLAPLAAVAAPVCAPGGHCPMAGAPGEPPPCHGTAIEADDCCLTAAVEQPLEAMPVIVALAPAAGEAAPAPPADADARRRAATDVVAPATPLYRLHRALLI